MKRLTCDVDGCSFITPATCIDARRALHWHRRTVHEGRVIAKPSRRQMIVVTSEPALSRPL